MASIASFSTTAGAWQSFYILVGTAAATLVGLMFVALAFGAGRVGTTLSSARAFADPMFTHFSQVLVTSAVVVFPTMEATPFGIVVIVIAALRLMLMVRVFRGMMTAQRAHADLELSDWVIGLVLPVAVFAMLVLIGAGFVAGYVTSFTALAVVTLLTLLLGMYGAWELMVWMAVTRREPAAGRD
jgi:hypothetical protein